MGISKLNLGSGTSGHQLEVLTLLTACILKKWKWVEFWYKFLKLVGGNMVGYTKLFHAAEFVHKHVRLKHLDLVMDLTSKVLEELYFYHYMNDTDAPGGQPVMQQPLPRDMPQRGRMDNQTNG
ncbi:serrate RNA effector molecule-like isoform X5 [Papaver somniferum]|uniref:serrate RNA effector molecule-like isoform X5 n=1 Tax=Papaver somniferum TaxID=3469 RepID=UPI000E702D0C|nr:serrate RNA effector molecule-like isoform X5 [Papaver somniferum]